MSELYQSFREANWPTQFGSINTPVTVDILIIGFIYAAVILAFSLIIVIPGVRGTKEKLFLFSRCIIGVFVISSIMVCNFGQEWETDTIITETRYRVGFQGNINASIGLHIGLRGINVTLKTDPETQTFQDGLFNETINYNERFNWDNKAFTQYASKFKSMYRDGQLKGLPYPILWVAEYFTHDAEGIRWGRYYRQAGYFTHIFLWLSLPLWLLALILFNSVIIYGGIFSIMTGISMLIGNIIFATIKNPSPLHIRFTDDQLAPTYGWSFYLCLATGLLCCVGGFAVVIAYRINSNATSFFFGIDTTRDIIQEYYDTDGDMLYGELTTAPDVIVRSGTSRSTSSQQPVSNRNRKAALNGIDNRAIELDDVQLLRQRGQSKASPTLHSDETNVPAVETSPLPSPSKNEMPSTLPTPQVQQTHSKDNDATITIRI